MPAVLRALPLAAACAALVAASFLVPAAPTYDPWAWLLWGRELLSLSLSTAEGPAWKPLTALLAAPLTLAGPAAPDLWLALARFAALAAAALAARVAWRLGGGAVGAGAAGLGMLVLDGLVWEALQGMSEGLLIALGLGAADRALAGRHRQAAVLAWAACLVRPEAWPFAALYAAWLWRTDRAARPALTAGALAVPALWLVPEWLASGDPFRSGARARVPNPGQPALADQPWLASLRAAVALPAWPLLICAPLSLLPAFRLLAAGRAARTARRAPWPARGVLLARTALAARALSPRPAALAALPAAAGLAWLALVAVMAEAGFSGEPRYALPGAALLSLAGALGLARLVAIARRSLASRTPAARRSPAARLTARVVPGAAALTLTVALVLTAATRTDRLVDLGPRLAHADALAADLRTAVTAAGGRARVLACGRPVVGPYRGTLMAWALAVPKERVAFTAAPGTVVFRSRLTPTSPLAPEAHTNPALRVGGWQVLPACRHAT